MSKQVKLRAVTKYNVDVNRLCLKHGAQIESRHRSSDPDGYWTLDFINPISDSQKQLIETEYEASLTLKNVIWDDDIEFDKVPGVFPVLKQFAMTSKKTSSTRIYITIAIIVVGVCAVLLGGFYGWL